MKSWCAKVSQTRQVFKQLHSRADILLLLEVFSFAVVVPLLLRGKLTRLPALLEPQQVRPAVDSARVQKLVSYVEYVLDIGRPLVRRSCLTRGLTLYYLLRKAGWDVALCFGTGSVDEHFAAHCWLVKDGEPFLEKSDPRLYFTPMYYFAAPTCAQPDHQCHLQTTKCSWSDT